MQQRVSSLIAVAALCLAACAERETAARLPQDLVLHDATIVDTRTGAVAPGMTIAIEDGKIAAISPAGAAPADSVSASGRFVVPGFLDLHAHPLQIDPDREIPLLLAHGITGYRQMSATPALLEARTSGGLAIEADAPELLAMPGLPLVTQLTSTVEAVVDEIHEQQALGADFIKVVSLEGEVFLAAADEAKRLGLPFVGHLSASVSAIDAGKHRMKSIEHLGPRGGLLLHCSSDEAALRETYASLPSSAPPGIPRPLAKLLLPLIERFLERLITNPVLQMDGAQVAVLGRLVDTYSEEKCLALAAELVRYGTWQCPTLVRTRAAYTAGDPVFTGDPALRFMPEDTRELWLELAQEFREKFSAAERDTFRRFFALQLRVVKLFDEAGVRLLAGSDSGGGQWMVSGASLHEEFDLLEAAGISPLRVLQMTTLDGATFLGREQTMGSVEVGKDANLVLLERNPIESVQNLHGVVAVVRAGRYYDAATLKVAALEE